MNAEDTGRALVLAERIRRRWEAMMPSYDPLAIANEFVKLNGGPMNQMRLQKLLYFAHGWNLAINREPLVNVSFEAWDGGPVVRALWNHLRDMGYNAADSLLGHPFSKKPYAANLLPTERAIVDQVWQKYGVYSGVDLSRMTHQPGTPWSNTYFGEGRNRKLSNDDIRQHFTEMAIAGRPAT